MTFFTICKADTTPIWLKTGLLHEKQIFHATFDLNVLDFPGNQFLVFCRNLYILKFKGQLKAFLFYSDFIESLYCTNIVVFAICMKEVFCV